MYKDIAKQREFQREWQRARNAVIRIKAIELLGGECVRCANKDIRVLEIDHIEPILRQVQGNSGINTAKLVVGGKLAIKDVQLLCANCHSIKTYEEDRKKFGKMLPNKYGFTPKIKL